MVPDPDSGTCWECGYAYQKKPVIVFRTDFRAGDEPGKAPFNLMLSESASACLDLAFEDTDKRIFGARTSLQGRSFMCLINWSLPQRSARECPRRSPSNAAHSSFCPMRYSELAATACPVRSESGFPRRGR